MYFFAPPPRGGLVLVFFTQGNRPLMDLQVSRRRDPNDRPEYCVFVSFRAEAWTLALAEGQD